ncbi:hypothetical protein CONLIGDRAFT_686988 [Coniochaeta ligniaria NRRL 30616]|uniref:C2H2-type domain-containing protein n=1 Tax=Coniochaeta ligniaria NRRL 30616 TaxID=1408157 RepID=A0A1J7I6B3_9PEZI|nr:hypothetical protein CONLIGDRAFT_686988 [Coniochaeta ligniaria NRRL 30616]
MSYQSNDYEIVGSEDTVDGAGFPGEEYINYDQYDESASASGEQYYTEENAPLDLAQSTAHQHQDYDYTSSFYPPFSHSQQTAQPMASDSTLVQHNSQSFDANSGFNPEGYEQGTSGNMMLVSAAGPSNWAAAVPSEVRDDQAGQSYACPDCDKVFEKLHKLRKHQKTHDPSIRCPAVVDCDFVTAEQRDMNRHLWVTHNRYARRHNIEDPGDQCDRCGKWFTRRDNLLKHLNKRRCRPAGGQEAGEDD